MRGPRKTSIARVVVSIAPFGSALQIQSIGLRYEVLRKPLGLVFEKGDLLNEGKEIHLVYSQGPLVVGCMLLKPIDNSILKMRQVAVDEQHQQKGIGKALAQYAENYALENGYQKIELHARETAVPFYLSMNYIIEGERFEEVGIPHFRMWKNI